MNSCQTRAFGAKPTDLQELPLLVDRQVTGKLPYYYVTATRIDGLLIDPLFSTFSLIYLSVLRLLPLPVPVLILY